jgi:hypothetical protein
MKNNKKGFASLILIGAVVVLLAIGGYFALKAKQQPPVKQVSTTSATETASWKTYTNNQYGFEFKYPASWALIENGTDGSIVNVQEPITSNTPKFRHISQDASGAQDIPITRSVFVYASEKENLADLLKGYEIDSQTVKTYPTFSINELNSSYLADSFITQFAGGGDSFIQHYCELYSCSTEISIPNRGLRIDASIIISDTTTFSGDLPNIIFSFNFTK